MTNIGKYEKLSCQINNSLKLKYDNLVKDLNTLQQTKENRRSSRDVDYLSDEAIKRIDGIRTKYENMKAKLGEKEAEEIIDKWLRKFERLKQKFKPFSKILKR